MGNIRLFLQDYYAKAWAENCMIYVEVDDAQSWYEHVASVLDHDRDQSDQPFSDARVTPPKKESYGANVTYVWDPSGVLLHFAQPVSK